MTNNLEARILNYLKTHKKAKARDLAAAFGTDKKEVNSLLYGKLNGKVKQNRAYEWTLVSDSSKSEPRQEQFVDSEIARLARYYLACLSHDESGISTFASSRYGDPDYVELAFLPTSVSAFEELTELREMAGRMRRDRSRMGVYFGYPTALTLIKSRRSNWQGNMVEPLFLYPLQETDGGRLLPDLSFPMVNQKCIRQFTNAGPSELMEEVVQLEAELGLTDTNEPSELDELVLRLRSIRPEWPWVEEPDASELPAEPRLSEANSPGLYNRAVLVLAERSPFTKGLESELGVLGKWSNDKLSGTALGQWLKGDIPDVEPEVDEEKPLLEVLPMNTEQRNAVSSSFTNSLTVITGPPGTGKSQVVTNLLANAAWRRQKVLFASKNNKAVDVVETRINELGPRPVLLRVGSNQYQNKLAEYLMALLSATATQDDEQEFLEHNRRQQELESQYRELEERASRLVRARNSVDQLDRELSPFRESIGQKRFHSLRTVDIEALTDPVAKFASALDRATREKQGIFGRLLWPITEKGRFEQLGNIAGSLSEPAAALGLSVPEHQPARDSLMSWTACLSELEQRCSEAAQVQHYFEQLQKLQSLPTLELISADQAQLTAEMASNAKKLWDAWLRLQPTRLTPADRQLLARYNATLKMMLDGAAEEQKARRVSAEYRKLLSKVSHLLSCWAVTSLSARGKIPFEAGYFDLVVFDEASQCDIASALPLLYRAKRAVVIGDPKQLSHISGMRRGQDHQLLDKFNLTESHPHWAYSYNSLFDLAAGLVAGSKIVSLRDHHRSHADIVEFSNNEFYEGRLRVATRYSSLRRPSSSEPGVKWIDVKGVTNRPQAGGAQNSIEAQKVVEVLRDLALERRYEGSIGVVSPFRAQANLIRRLVNDDEALAQQLLQAEFLVDTVHKFQGDERDVMLFSPVISRDTPPSALGFLRNNGNLFNVAITRARGQLLVVGDRSACADCDISYLARFAGYAATIEQRTQEEARTTTENLGPTYPAVANPEQVSDWERYFYEKLYAAGIFAIPQYRVEKFALDFAVFDGDRCLDVEVDGERYHRNWTGERCRRDQLRNQRLFELGWDVRRFWVYEVRDDVDACIAQIRDWISRKKDVA